MSDLFNFLLTGIRKNEYTIASTSQLLNAETKSYDREIFYFLGLPMHITMPIVEPGTLLGRLLPEIGEETGLVETNVVTVACHDTASAVAAIPADKGEWAYLSSGTWSCIGIESDKPFTGDKSLKNNFTNEGGVFETVRFLKNVMGLWLLQQVRKYYLDRGDGYGYEELVRLAQREKEFLCIIDPDDSSFLNPADMIGAIQTYCRKTGQNPPRKPGEFTRCVLESLALKYKFVLEKLGSVTGKSVDTLHIVGGGSKNEMLNQFTADACGVPVVAGPAEATAVGNILMQAIADGKIGSIEKGRKIILKSFPIKTYSPENMEKWNKIYSAHKSLFS